MPNRVFWSLMTILIVSFSAYVTIASLRKPATPEQPIVSKEGIHWHPHLAIYIKGQQQLIPADLGVKVGAPVHTHDSSGILHYELSGPVRKNFVQLKMFFSTWGQPFDVIDLLGSKNVPKGSIKMTVNGKPNAQFGDYQVKDKDQIVISYG